VSIVCEIVACPKRSWAILSVANKRAPAGSSEVYEVIQNEVSDTTVCTTHGTGFVGLGRSIRDSVH
jgi:hypothetical protein